MPLMTLEVLLLKVATIVVPSALKSFVAENRISNEPSSKAFKLNELSYYGYYWGY